MLLSHRTEAFKYELVIERILTGGLQPQAYHLHTFSHRMQAHNYESVIEQVHSSNLQFLHVQSPLNGAT